MIDKDIMPKPQRPTKRQKRQKNCTFCRNHNIVISKTGHSCRFQGCKCLLCQLTSLSHVVMKYQQALWRHQSRYLAEHTDPLMRRLAQKRSQLCDKCRNHNKFCEKRGHKTKCEHENCRCVLCQLTDKRRLIMKYQQRVRRANVTAEEIPSDEDESDGQTVATPGKDYGSLPETAPDNSMNICHGVTQLLDSISVMLDDFSRQFPTLKRKIKVSVDDVPKSEAQTQVCNMAVQSTSTQQPTPYINNSNVHSSHPPLNNNSNQSYEHFPTFQPWNANINRNNPNGMFSGICQEQVRDALRGATFSKMQVQDYWTTRIGHRAHPFLDPTSGPHRHPLHRPQMSTTFHPQLYPPMLNASSTFSIPPQPAENFLLCTDSSYQVWKHQFYNSNAHFNESMIRRNRNIPADAYWHQEGTT
ncbi:DM DNA-binding domain [Trinorchestia longiramus]|nr:DM DNA-binding domain [Trinorchestia longiramus]